MGMVWSAIAQKGVRIRAWEGSSKPQKYESLKELKAIFFVQSLLLDHSLASASSLETTLCFVIL